MKGLVRDFGHFKATLATEQSLFVKECANASDAMTDLVSCGNTVRCFGRLFTQDKRAQKQGGSGGLGLGKERGVVYLVVLQGVEWKR
eukprot:g29126.t1